MLLESLTVLIPVVGIVLSFLLLVSVFRDRPR